jgi:hypothetical protein
MVIELRDMTVDDLKRIIHDTVQEAVEDAIEDLVATSSPSFVESIRESREEAKAGHLTPLDAVARS